MKSREDQISFIGKQAELERHLARLYLLYQTKFPEFKLWPFLVEEERKHEAWLKQIIPKIKAGDIYFFLDELTYQAIEQTIEYINEEYEKADKEGIDLVRAISVAHSIEDSALDKNVFQYFDSESPSIEEILDNLREDTKKHREMLNSQKKILMKEVNKYK
jgi:rubrerythrin